MLCTARIELARLRRVELSNQPSHRRKRDEAIELLLSIPLSGLASELEPDVFAEHDPNTFPLDICDRALNNGSTVIDLESDVLLGQILYLHTGANYTRLRSLRFLLAQAALACSTILAICSGMGEGSSAVPLLSLRN